MWTGSRLFLLALSLLLLTACETGVYHTVKPGQTLYRISRTYGVSERDIKFANGVGDPKLVRSGTRLFIPGAYQVLPVPVANPPIVQKPAVSNTQKNATPSPTVSSKPAPVKTVSSIKQTPPRKPTVQSTEVKKLQWPLRGKIIRSFSAQAKAGGGKGIEIAVRSGSTVQAAEAGKVIYSGDGVSGYGHLIILQHENDLFTVYGFNQQNFTRQGDFVSKGEKIALSGVPPSGGSPRLHFEVRKGKQAVDPILYLP